MLSFDQYPVELPGGSTATVASACRAIDPSVMPGARSSCVMHWIDPTIGFVGQLFNLTDLQILSGSSVDLKQLNRCPCDFYKRDGNTLAWIIWRNYDVLVL